MLNKFRSPPKNIVWDGSHTTYASSCVTSTFVSCLVGGYPGKTRAKAPIIAGDDQLINGHHVRQKPMPAVISADYRPLGGTVF